MNAGAALRVLEPAVSTDGPLGKVVLTVLGMVGELELSFIRDRHKAGIEAAKQKGVYKSRSVTLDYGKIRALKSKGLGTSEIAKTSAALGGQFTRYSARRRSVVRLCDHYVRTNELIARDKVSQSVNS